MARWNKALGALSLVSLLSAGAPASADDTPAVGVTVASAVTEFRAHGFDLLVADARTREARADQTAARALPNPVLSPTIGRAPGYDARCSGCSANTYGVSLADPSALSDILEGKRGLRERVAAHAVRSAQLARKDAEQQLVADVKIQVATLAGAEEKLEIAKKVRDGLAETAAISAKKYPAMIDEGQLARIEREALTADNTVDKASADVRDASVGLAFLLGNRSVTPPTYDASADALNYRIPNALTSASAEQLAARATSSRASVKGAESEVARTSTDIDRAKRERLPSFGLSLGYSQTGTGNDALNPPTVLFGLSIPLPLFYQQQGEIDRATASRDEASVLRDKAIAQATNDVRGAFSDFVAYRSIVERSQGALQARAKTARDITELQYRAGAIPLTDYLDAQRSYFDSSSDSVDSLVAYWTAIYRLEAAVGEEFS